ncbi:MAG: hypothetical protein LBJ20_07830 [Candidatus Methanoplasma sp.]|jgi:hypothetical protein|nr:hypothetical protein [Candidatus Methanoplasma sp.]
MAREEYVTPEVVIDGGEVRPMAFIVPVFVVPAAVIAAVAVAIVSLGVAVTAVEGVFAAETAVATTVSYIENSSDTC